MVNPQLVIISYPDSYWVLLHYFICTLIMHANPKRYLHEVLRCSCNFSNVIILLNCMFTTLKVKSPLLRISLVP